jgi:capsular polysaccharide biosynthesis protein
MGFSIPRHLDPQRSLGCFESVIAFPGTTMDNWFHVVHDVLPLAVLIGRERLGSATVLAPEWRPYAEEALRLAGAEHIVPMTADSYAFAQEVFFWQDVVPLWVPRAEVLQVLRNFTRRVAAQRSLEARNVFINRERGRPRYLANAGEIVTIMNASGCGVVEISAWRSVRAAMGDVPTLDLLAAAHGAALGNFVFMRRGAIAAEVQCEEPGGYVPLAVAVGLRYVATRIETMKLYEEGEAEGSMLPAACAARWATAIARLLPEVRAERRLVES